MSSGAPCRFLEWDSAHFGKRIAQIEGKGLTAERAREIASWCESNAIDCAYLLLDSGDLPAISVAEDTGFRFVDLRLTLEQELKALPAPPREGIRPFGAGDVPRLCEIARQSHHATRFYRDAGFDRGRSDDLYETWIRKSCGGEADAVFVAAPDGTAAGYLTCHLAADGSGKIGLVAVATQAQGGGWGRALVQEGLRWFGQNSVGRVSVVTQGANVAAVRLYESCGFLTKTLETWFHRWFGRSGEGEA
jgi:GNAT superfamily N-acetyltransferase